MKRYRIPILFAVIFLPIIFFSVQNTRYSSSMLDDKHSFTTLTGEKLTLSQFHGKPLLVTFWATDCPSCIKEIPALIKLYQHYHAYGLEMIAIAMYYDPPSHVVAMTKTLQLPYPVILDIKGDHARAFGNVALTPTTFLLDRNGKVSLSVTGLFDENDLSERIEALLEGETLCCG